MFVGLATTQERDKQKMCLKLWQAKCDCQAMFMVAKRTSMRDKKNSKRLPSNVCLFGRGF